MWHKPSVMIAMVVSGTILGLGLLAVIGALLFYGKDTGALLSLVNAVLTAAIYSKVRNVESRATRIEQQTNGTTTRLMDHALGPPPKGE